MKAFRSRYTRRVLVPVMAVSLLSACGPWKVQEMTPSQVVSEREPGKIRLTMLDGDEIVLKNPWVSDGEILAHPLDPYNQVYGVISSDTVRVPSDSVAYVEIYETPSAARWALALPLAVGGYFLLMAVIDRFTEW